ncbi:MAG: DUF3256 family protein [Prevotella sp.]|nr:DUF3256 family protein [Prevotella sp.]
MYPQKAQAQSLSQFWSSMPDSLMPYLDKGKRMELLDYAKMGTKKEVKSQFNQMVTLDTITDNFMQVTLNEELTLQMKRLPVEDEDSVFCVVKSFGKEAVESTVIVYNQDWSPRSRLTFSPQLFSEQIKTHELLDKVELERCLPMVAASLNADNDEMRLRVSYQLLSQEEKRLLKDEEVQLNVKWNGETFNKCY